MRNEDLGDRRRWILRCLAVYGDGRQTRSFCYEINLIEGIARMMNSTLDQKGNISVTFKLADGPRVTKVDKFNQWVCIDEPPQLVNIMYGDMSYVGLHPLLICADAQLSEYDRNRCMLWGSFLCF